MRWMLGLGCVTCAVIALSGTSANVALIATVTWSLPFQRHAIVAPTQGPTVVRRTGEGSCAAIGADPITRKAPSGCPIRAAASRHQVKAGASP